MTCDAIRQILLDLGTDDQQRRRAAEALQHLETCQGCQAAAQEFDRIAAALDVSADESTPIGGWEQFERRLSESNHSAIGLRPERRRRVSWPLATAASVLLALGAFEIGRHVGPTSQTIVEVGHRDNQSMATGRFTPLDLPANVSAFEEVSKVFDGRASWMLVSKDASDVGVSAVPISADRHVLLLHLTMSRGVATVSEADLMIVPGQTANLTLPLGEGQSLHYRIGASGGEPTRLAIWLEVVTAHGGEALGALSTHLQIHPGEKLNAGELVTSAGDYQLKVGFAQAELGAGNP